MDINFNGVVPSGDDIRDYTIIPTAISFPANFTLKRLPTVLNQNSIGSCVAHACSSTLQIYNNKQFSTDFIYGYRPSDYYIGIGMRPRDACQTMVKIGNCLKTELDGNTEVTNVIDKVNSQLNILISRAAPYKIESYARIYNISELQTSLYNGMPVLLTTNVYMDFNAGKDGILKNTKNTGLRGAHEMVVVGWETINKQLYFYVLNSWGTVWGKNGFCYMKSDMITNLDYVTEMYAVADKYIDENVIRRTLRNGMNGDDVKELQTKLNKLGYSCGTADGIFGAKTDAAVKAYQKANKLTVDGIVGKNTWNALDKE